MKSLLREYYNSATEADIKSAKSWYYKAKQICNQISRTTGTPINIVVGVMAALSVQNKWERNIIDCKNFIKSEGYCSVATFNSAKDKASRILNSSGSNSEILKILNGPKITQFYTNIRFPKTSNCVTLDRWAYRAVGVPESGLRKAQRQEVVDAYREVANEVGMLPHEFQALVWEQVRNI